MPILYPNQKPQYEGCVLATRERNYHDDSDFYAVVWNEDQQRLIDIEYDTTRFAGGGSARVDATEETKAKARAWLKNWAKEKMIEESAELAKVPQKGRRVRVVRGREKGAEGVLFWTKAMTFSRYGRGPDTIKVGIATSEAKDSRGFYTDVVWTYLKNCEVAEPEQYIMTEAEAEQKASHLADYWALPFSRGNLLVL